MASGYVLHGRPNRCAPSLSRLLPDRGPAIVKSPQLFIGHVMHRRLRPALHTFSYPVFFVRLPLARLAAADNAIFAVDRANLMSFHQRDHGPRDGSALLPWIQRLLRERGLPDDGEVVLQTFPRVLGYVFNPVSFWFCHDRRGELIALLAEVSNTFGERHHYLLHNPDGKPLVDGQVLIADKALHVSPFCKVEGVYRFRLALDGPIQRVGIDYADASGTLLLTALSGRPRAWFAPALLGAFLRMPLLTLGVMARIHWQALRLWLKKVPFHGTQPPAPQPIPEGPIQ
jgi:DUF1365 family protein